MKRITLFIFLAGVLISCKKENLNPNSVIIDQDPGVQTALDKYILRELTTPYNIDVVYKFVDAESDQNYNLSPATYQSSIRMTRLLQYLGTDPYDVVTGSKDHIRRYFPKLVNYIGSPAYRNNGTIVLGTAEGGRKITLYMLNELEANATNAAYLDFYYFHTIHHEFAHIHNQLRPYPPSFKEISGTKYVQDSWNTQYTSVAASVTDGFISPYASNEDREDFVEIMSFYISMSAAAWETRISSGGTAGAAGKAIIQQKLAIVKQYYQDMWNINLDDMRAEILRRQANLATFDQLNIN